MSSLLAPASRSAAWRIISMLGILYFVLAPVVVALNSTHNNGTQVPGTLDVDVSSFNKHAGGQILSMPLRRIDHRGIATPSIAKRFFKAEVLGVFGAAYLAELTIGTSKDGTNQVIDVLIDTGSFELWVNPVCSASNMPEFCEVFGHYDPARSSTSHKVNSQFQIKYGSGQVAGDYYKDDIYISGVKIDGQQFGVANSSELVWFGILGLAHGQGKGVINYPLLIDSVAARGLSNSKLFSMDLGKQFSPGGAITGELVFGGVDTNKYSGLLKKVPTDLYDPHYRITLNSLSHRPAGSAISTPFIDSNLPLSVIVDSGTTLSHLPEPLVNKVAAQFPGAEPDGSGGYRVDCATQSMNGSVDFNFLSDTGPVTINVAYRDFIWNSGGDCFLGVWSSKDLGVWILGDTFLRAAYIAFDQTNNALFMSNYISCGDGQSNLVTVPTGPDAAANIPGACSVSAGAPQSTSVSSATFPGGTVSPTVIPTIASTLGPTLNPVGPPPDSSPGAPGHKGSPTDTTALAPTQGSSPGDPKADGAGSAMRKPGGVDVPMMTITDTITRAVVHTISACPETVTNCPFRNQVSTRYETVITTYCPSHHDATMIPQVTPAATNAVVPVTEPSASASTIYMELGYTPGPSEEQQQQGNEVEEVVVVEESEEGKQAMITTVYSTPAITSCASGDHACAAGGTTTRVTTISKTVVVHPVPTLSAGEYAPGSNKNVSMWNSSKPVVVPAAAPADDAQIDKRYLGGAFVLVWGVMVLL
ncbi:aspartic peptidase domain-containing protein [Xylaria venustula]|nr:aspartic peptidase domain-containing protein [Xylaria venustula]